MNNKSHLKLNINFEFQIAITWNALKRFMRLRMMSLNAYFSNAYGKTAAVNGLSAVFPL